MPPLILLPSQIHRCPASPQVDWGKDITRGLLWAVVPVVCRDEIVGGARGSLLTSGAWGGRTREGLALESTSVVNGGASWAQSGRFSFTNQFTAIARFEWDSKNTYNHILAIPYRATGWTSPYATLSIYRNAASADIACLWAYGSSSYRNIFFTVDCLGADITPLQTIAITRNSATHRLFKDGMLLEETSPGGYTANIDNTYQQPVTIFNHSSTSNEEGSDGRLIYAYIWNRPLDVAEIMSMHVDPYQIFARGALSRTIFIQEPSGAEKTFAANLTATADFAAAAAVDRALAANLQATADLAAAVSVIRTLAADLSSTADLGASISVDRRIVASLEALAEFAANFTTAATKEFAADMLVTADLGAAVAVVRQLAAALSASADLSIAASVDRRMTAALDALAEFAAAITIEVTGVKEFAANFQATADFAAAVAMIRQITAALSASADLEAAVAVDRKLAAALTVLATLAAELDVDRNLAVSLSATADLAAAMTLDCGMAALLEATADLQAAVSRDRSLAASLTATANFLAALSIVGSASFIRIVFGTLKKPAVTFGTLRSPAVEISLEE